MVNYDMSTVIAKEICVQMMNQRGYLIDNENDKFTKMKDSEGEVVMVFMDESPKLNKQMISNYISCMNTENCKHSVIVYSQSVTTMTSKSIEQSVDIEIELFSADELQFNITKHRLQPKSFKKLSNTENEYFRKHYGTKIPILKRSDKISRFFNFSPGDIIMVVDRRDIVSHRIVR